MIYRVKPTVLGYLVCRYEVKEMAGYEYTTPLEYRTGTKWSGHKREAKIYLRPEDATNGIVQGRFKR